MVQYVPEGCNLLRSTHAPPSGRREHGPQSGRMCPNNNNENPKVLKPEG